MHILHHDVVKRADARQLERRETRVAPEVIVEREVPRRRVDAHRQIEPLRLLPHRRQIRVAQPVRPLDSAHKHRARAVVLAEPQLLEALVERHRGQHDRPPQPSAALPVNIRQPAVVALRQREVNLRVRGERAQENAGIQHVRAHAQLVHMRQPLGDVARLPRRLVRIQPHVHAFREGAGIYVPKLRRRRLVPLFREQHDGPQMLRLLRNEVPRALRLHHVRVSVYDCHALLLPCALPECPRLAERLGECTPQRAIPQYFAWNASHFRSTHGIGAHKRNTSPYGAAQPPLAPRLARSVRSSISRAACVKRSPPPSIPAISSTRRSPASASAPE